MILRAVLMGVALFFVWAADHVLFRMNIARARTFITPVGSWLWWICLLAIAGIAFGLAAMLPEHLRYHPVRALVLAIVPLLMLTDFTLSLGPSSLVRFGRDHLDFLVKHEFFFNGQDSFAVSFALAVFLGVAIASGFGPGEGIAGGKASSARV
jgi:hypothetical protein